MPFGNAERVLTYSRERGIFKTAADHTIPDWVKTAIEDSNGTQDYDASYAFSRNMALAGARMLETYGQSNESIDVWVLPDDEGWLIVHFDGDDCDAFFYFEQLAHYMEFQGDWLAPMAKKIMDEEQYLTWKNEMEKAVEAKPCLH